MGKKDDTVKRLAVGGAIAAAAGYVAGILTAPKSGKQTRDDIKEAASKGLREAEKELKNLNADLAKVLAESKKHADKLSSKAQKDLDVLIERATDTKEKAREMISAIHDGDAQDKDLKKAVQDATAALENLRKYLQK